MPGSVSSTGSPWTVWTSCLQGRTGLLVACGAVGALLVGAAVFQRTGGGTTPLVTCSVTEFRTLRQQLQAAGLGQAEFRNGQVHVPSAEVETYRTALASSRATDANSGGRWADVWQSATDRLSQFSGSQERNAAREIARAQTIGRLLSELPDVAAADVVWDETPAGGWREPPRVRATVYLKAEEGRAIGPHVVDAVRRAVAGSKANLSPADVVVMDQSSGATYDGDEIDPQTARNAQAASWHRDQIESALSYLPGVRVDVRVDTPDRAMPRQYAANGDELPAEGPDSADELVAVSVSIPEATIRELAGLNGTATAQDSSRRREVYRSVEQHLHATVREKVARLVPHGSSATANERIYVETLPAPPSPVPANQSSPADELAALVREHQMLLVAVALGLGAVVVFASMLRKQARRPVKAEFAREPLPAGSVPADRATAPAIGVPQKVTALQPASPADPPLETTSGATAQSSVADPASAPRDSSTEPRTLYAGRHDGPRRDILEDVLTRIESAAAPGAINESGPTELHQVPSTDREQRLPRSWRLPDDEASPYDRVRSRSTQESAATSPRPRRASTLGSNGSAAEQIESLAGLEPSRLAALARAVDVTTWSRALYGTSLTLQAQILPQLPTAEAARLTADLRAQRPIRLRDIDEAQSAVLRVWRDLAEENAPAAVSAAGRPAEAATP